MIINFKKHRENPKTNTKLGIDLQQAQSNRNWKLKIPNKSGFTIAELLMATLILGVLVISAAGIYTNFYNSIRNLKAANLVYDEARFTMERIVKEIRNGTIDYEEYYNQSVNFKYDINEITNETFGDNYCQYSRQFYSPGPDKEYGTYDDESTGLNKNYGPDGKFGTSDDINEAPINNVIQKNLYIINAQGNKRSYIKRIETSDGQGKVGMVKLVGKDYGLDHIDSEDGGNLCFRDSGEKDGLIDTWECEKGFYCPNIPVTSDCPDNICNCTGTIDKILDDPNDLSNSSFIDITPESLDIVDLSFFLTPTDDPHKAYNDSNVQIQPHVTVRLTARATEKIASSFKGGTPSIVLESTISSRAYTEIITECNLQECIDKDIKTCPKTFYDDNSGDNYSVEVECKQSVWPLCTDDIYMTYLGSGDGPGLDSKFKNFSAAPNNYPNGLTYYEAQTEIGSCDTLFPKITEEEKAECKELRCTDGFDNDGNGLVDQDDHSCILDLCNNGIFDPGVEECTDVGGNCYMRQKELKETSCTDGYDNDCSYNFNIKWGNLTDEQRTQLESLGYSSNSTTPELNIGLGLGADEYDINCIELFCSNGIKDKGIGDKDYDTPNYLIGKDYSQEGDWDEMCKDIGGLCELMKTTTTPSDQDYLPSDGETGDYCYDGFDNDCDYDKSNDTEGADEFDSGCISEICSNNEVDNELIDPAFINDIQYFKNYLVNYSDPLNLVATALDESCKNIGGLCESMKIANPLSDQSFLPSDDGETGTDYCSDGFDNDCDGKIDQLDNSCCYDEDSDNFQVYIAGQCEPAHGNALNPPFAPPYGARDCDDSSDIIKPQELETTCDDAVYPLGHELYTPIGTPIDENCSGVNERTSDGWDHNDPTCCVDTDGDGYGMKDFYIYDDPDNVICDGSFTSDIFDCDDLDPVIYPGNPEVCDGKDNDCSDPDHSDGVDPAEIDEGVGTIYYVDSDLDEYGDSLLPPVFKCSLESGYSSNDDDCRDDLVDVNPGATEICGDGLDNNCDGQENENLLDTYYLDNDSDGYGDPNNSISGSCSTSGYVLDDTDCDDSNININTDAMEICDDAGNVDEDCDTYNGYHAQEGGCLTSNKRTFYDFLGTQDYIASLDPEVTSGVAYLEVTGGSVGTPIGGYATSKKLPLLEAGCSQITQITSITYELTGASSNFNLDLQFSTDNGATWCGDDNCTGDSITYDEVKISNTVNLPISLMPSNSLIWRANFVTTENVPPKRWSRLAITFKCTGD